MDYQRAIIAISGEDTEEFLQGIITNDIKRLLEDDDEPSIYAAMLSPQGKFQHDFILISDGEKILIDHNAAESETLLKRLKLYKLRADVTIELHADWVLSLLPVDSEEGLEDPRHPELPNRHWGGERMEDAMSTDAYHAKRLALGVPEGGFDITEKETALDAGIDMLNGVSFTKGCYVGQEVTARMHYKGIARKGFARIEGSAPLPEGAQEVTSNEKTVADLRSQLGSHALVFGRLDTIYPVIEAGGACSLGEASVTLSTPAWQDEKIKAYLDAARAS